MRKKLIPFDFVLEILADLEPYTKPMFGCTAIYIEDKIVLVLRDKPDSYVEDNGVWLGTTTEHHESLRKDFPNMRSIGLLSKKPTAWQLLPVSAPDFEESVNKACEFILAGDPRIGKVPKSKLKNPRSTAKIKRKKKKRIFQKKSLVG